MSIVGAPSYFENHQLPQTPQDLVEHRAINLRLPTSDTLNAWRVTQNGQESRVRVDGPLIFNTIDLILDAVLDGHGLAYLPSDQVHPHIREGRLVAVLQDSLPTLPGYHLYMPTDAPPRQPSGCSFRPYDGAAAGKRNCNLADSSGSSINGPPE